MARALTIDGASYSRFTVAAIAVAVGVVLADSSIVTLALPAVLRQFDAEVADVAWVLIAFNLALALAAVPVAWIAQRGPTVPLYAGLVVFGVASAACAAAPSLLVLIAARIVQALGGAAIVCASLQRLSLETGSDARAAKIWGVAGVTGVALGPAIGGLLTEAISWQSIFIFQVPVALVVLVVLAISPSPDPRVPEPRVAGDARPHIAANLALLLISAALTAALFLLVLLLIEGWLKQPAAAGLTVTVMPIAAFAAGWFAHLIPDGRTRVEAGAIAIAGGLAALGLMPGAAIGWTIAPQVLIGAGLGLTVQALTYAALHGRSQQAIHGGWTIAARHAGVVVGLLLLTPIFTADLKQNQRDAQLAGTALLLDSRLPPLHRIDLGEAIAERISQADGRVPDIAPAFADNPPPPGERVEQIELQAKVESQVARAATHAFSTSFLVAAILALLALVPAVLGRGRLEL